MGKTVKATESPIIDAKKNEALAHAVVDDYPKEVSGAVGMHALGKLSEMMPHEQFITFLEGALHQATTGEMPPQQDEDGAAESPSPVPQAE